MHLPNAIYSSLSLFLSLPLLHSSGVSGMAISPQPNMNTPRDAQDTPPAMPRITSISYSGDGCPSSTANSVEKTGNGGFGDVGFRLNTFETSTSTGTSTTKACQIHLQTSSTCSPGWQVGIQTATVKGRLVLDPGAGVDWWLVSFWSERAGDTSTLQGSITNTGPSRTDDVVTLSSSSGGDIAWSPCSSSTGYLGILNVNFRVAVDGGYGYFGKAAGGNGVLENWGFVWRRC
ncbi:hypothetical protein F5Y17DRAFT_285857 [Xylariaceae sp. FL0594]|nr:hypothetical protein F5Y17DRAFT_285857 [Xylariaceae sp. FL0594]